ncbi:hypothetical protein C0V70_04665 [Bacteriovorax stolpii]|uniref:Uncharacterized protein n=1 Tax=Bacteriovorax stolpii TaxID=960 RepID=A0A2K9NPI9_BACTC|nr:hypothetical protein [Bacteriovorax stolpii]AUN97412.1 hypothetical protein C0V70_04665 [Bacteriovorax stolpii]TDP52587.1 hypothetical protein C8D79_2353 [Bacteriovorax stolpii]
MKKTIVIAALSLSTTLASAATFSEQTLANSTIQTVANVVANMIVISSQASSIATTENRKMEAQMIQNDIQDYAVNGTISVYLASKIEMVKSVNAELSTEESIDVLILASESILN